MLKKPKSMSEAVFNFLVSRRTAEGLARDLAFIRHAPEDASRKTAHTLYAMVLLDFPNYAPNGVHGDDYALLVRDPGHFFECHLQAPWAMGTCIKLAEEVAAKEGTNA